MTTHNGHSTAAQQEQAQRVLRGLLVVLLEMDTATFRQVTEAPDSATHAEVLEALHLARLEHPGVNRVQRGLSRIWLQEHEL